MDGNDYFYQYPLNPSLHLIEASPANLKPILEVVEAASSFYTMIEIV